MTKNLSIKSALLIFSILTMASGVGLVESIDHRFHGFMLIIIGASMIVLEEFISSTD